MCSTGDNPLSDALTQIIGSANSARGRIKSISLIRMNGGRVAWSPDGSSILIDRKNADGYYDVFLLSPDGSMEKCLTSGLADTLGVGHIGQPAWHPSGKYIVFQAQKKYKQGRWGRDLAATPGFGRHSDLWLMELKTRLCHRLTNTKEGISGVLHPHFSHDGSILSWTEMIEEPAFLKGYGKWLIKLANFRFHKGRPSLSKVRSYQPGSAGWYENHGLSRDNKRLLFTATFENSKAFHSNVYTYEIATKRLKCLAKKKWNEHALYSPSGMRIVWMSGMNNKRGGTDYWIMNTDGSDKVRLSDWNNPKLQSYRRKMIIAADASFSPTGKHLVAYLQTNLLTQDGVTILIELKKNWERPGSSN